MNKIPNESGIGDFRRNHSLEALLKEVNEWLAVSQETINQQYQSPRLPVLLLMGAPHSGTTLFMQWLSESQQWAYPTNFISRFYAAPYLGARIQQMMIENDIHGEISGFRPTQRYSSTLGKTEGALAPHEFWYFWRRFFQLEPEADVVSPENLQRVDVLKLKRELASLETALAKPLAMKAMLLNFHIPFLDAAFENVLFVNLRREPAYVVQSMLEARQKQYGSEENWYSFKPPEYAWLKKLTPIEQVAGQIHFIRKATDSGIAMIKPARCLNVEYEAFCQNPAAVWQSIVQKISDLGYHLDPNYNGTDHFNAANIIRTSAEKWNFILRAVEMADNHR